MTRDEEFNNIPELGPARDALDQPKIPSLKKASGAAATARVAGSSAPGTRAGSGGFMPWLLLLMMLVIGAGGYWGMTHIKQLQLQLTESNSRLSSLEGLINATDDNANKSGAALQARMSKFMLNGDKRLKHVDSELAKLWAVAYQRNKPKIDKMDQALAALNKQSGELLAQSTQLRALLKKTQTDLDKAGVELAQFGKGQNALLTQLADLKGGVQVDLADLGGRLQLWDQANQELDSLQDTQLLQFEQQLQALKKNPAVPIALSRSVKEHEQAIAAINSFRKQVNSELLRLAAQIKLLQSSARSGSSVPVASKTQ
ncbi:MAG: hypothetical protein V7629_17780 [Motiliproteus sp.]